jgi:hypothetical protein
MLFILAINRFYKPEEFSAAVLRAAKIVRCGKSEGCV